MDREFEWTPSKDTIAEFLGKFFLESLAEDPGHVAEWMEAEGLDADEFVGAAKLAVARELA